MSKLTRKEIAIAFLREASAGNVRAAYEKYVHPAFRHHNPYFKGDRELAHAGHAGWRHPVPPQRVRGAALP